jgi:hypothetical protein
LGHNLGFTYTDTHRYEGQYVAETGGGGGGCFMGRIAGAWRAQVGNQEQDISLYKTVMILRDGNTVRRWSTAGAVCR